MNHAKEERHSAEGGNRLGQLAQRLVQEASATNTQPNVMSKNSGDSGYFSTLAQQFASISALSVPA